MRYTGLSLSQTPPRMSSTSLQQHQLVTTTRQGGSREPAPESAAATVSESQVSQPSELTALLQQLVTQQREDRLAQEEARRAHEAQLAAIQREAARERAATEERFVGLIDRVSQRIDAQFQQMQQGMMAMFGMISQLYSHTGLAPQ